MKARWIIQDNLIAQNDLKQIREACEEIGVEFEETFVLPFSNELPKFTIDDKTNIYYGSTTLMYNIYQQLNKPIGLFFNEDTFSMENYIKQWGEHMLNSEAKIITVKEFIGSFLDPEELIFIRPDGDDKSFDGQVVRFKFGCDLMKRHLEYDSNLTENSKILIGPAYNIKKEWRNYIVDGKIVSSSQYRSRFTLFKSKDVPEEMLEFVRQRISEYKPHDNFAIDIASTDDGTYYIIECGCLNSVGFYHADIKEIVKSVTKYVEKL